MSTTQFTQKPLASTSTTFIGPFIYYTFVLFFPQGAKLYDTLILVATTYRTARSPLRPKVVGSTCYNKEVEYRLMQKTNIRC